MSEAGELKYRARWTEADFESMCWHDCTIHGFRLRNPEPRPPDEGYDYDLILELDIILAWLPEKCGEHTAFQFAVAPARLVFKNVDRLRIAIEATYKQSMLINHIEREEIATEAQREAGCRPYRWSIQLHPMGAGPSQIAFEATGFEQTLTGPPVVQDGQDIPDE